MTRVIGLTGLAGAGKTTVAERLRDKHGYAVVSIADPIRALLLQQDPIVGYAADGVQLRLATLVGTSGWELTKRSMPEVRALMQRTGDGLKAATWPWILSEKVNEQILRYMAESRSVVITDVRSIAEAAEVRGWTRGVVWRIERPGVTPVNEHHTETLQPQGDLVIVNSGTLAKLHRDVDGAVLR